MAAKSMTMEASIPEAAALKMAQTTEKRDNTKWLHKTRLCIYRVQGSCRLGSKCSFAHDVSDVLNAPNLHKTQICVAYEQGNCKNKHCTFAHGQEELRQSPHFKSRVCKWFGQGACRNGDECGFAHSKDELQSQPKPHVEAIAAPPGLSLGDETQIKMVLDLAGSLVDARAPASLEDQVGEMSASIAALQSKMDEMALRSQVSDMKQVLGQLSGQCAMLEQQLVHTESAHVAADASRQSSSKTKLTPLSSKAQSFVPNFCLNRPIVPAAQWADYADCGDSYLYGDESTDVGSSNETGGFSSD